MHGRHQEPDSFLKVLHDAADGEGHDRKNRSGQSEIAQTGVQAGMSYYINNSRVDSHVAGAEERWRVQVHRHWHACA